jgi:rhodanese-related sulfurtransferase
MGVLYSFSGGDNINNINADLFEEKIESDKNAVIIDVRTRDEYINVRIPDSVLIDIYSNDFLEKIGKLDRSKSYYVYCHSGARSYSAVESMMKMGFENVYNLAEGIISWNGKIERG